MKRLGRRGFTLVELLAVIAVLSIILAITIFIATDTIDSAKKKSYQVTINNIEDDASNYLIENEDKLYFIDKGMNTNIEYQCITVKNLIDMGYFKENVEDSKVSDNQYVEREDYIYLERDKNTKTLINSVYLYDSDDVENSLCDKAGKALGIVDIVVEPSGWAREKEVTIGYRVKNTLDQSKYNNYYKIIGTNESVEVNGNSVKFSVSKNGYIYAYIENNTNSSEILVDKMATISGIDNEGPVITREDTGSGSFRGSDGVTIPLIVTDSGVGVDFDSFTKEDIVVTIGGIVEDNISLTLREKISNNKYIYNLVIGNTSNTGIVKIEINDNMVFDLLENGNEDTIIDTSIEIINSYKINYVLNGGVNSSDNPTEYVYGVGVSSFEDASRDGYTFLGWYNDSSFTTKITSISKNETGDKTLYAKWRINKVYVKYDMNSGTWGGSTNTNLGYRGSLITRANGPVSGDTTIVSAWNYGATTDVNGLANYDNSTYINIKRKGYVAVPGKEWKKSDGTTFSDDGAIDTADLCDATKGDCTVILYVNWRSTKVNVKYNVNGGTIASSTKNSAGTTTYYWKTSSSGVVQKASSANGTYSDYVSSYNYGATDKDLANYDNSTFMKITRSGYIGVASKEWKKSDGTTFSDDEKLTLSKLCDASYYDCTVTLYVNWFKISHTHSWNARGNRIIPMSGTYTLNCGETHDDGYVIYCSHCGMSAKYYQSLGNSLGTYVCPNNPYGASDDWKIFDDASVMSSMTDQEARAYIEDDRCGLTCGQSMFKEVSE